MSLEIFLLSMQAAGTISDMWGTNQQIKLGRKGAQIEQNQITNRLEEERNATLMNSIDAMKALRQTLASQRAISAARGTQIGSGSQFFMGAQSIATHEVDQRISRMNLLSREAQLRAAGALSGLHQLSSETKLGQQMTQRNFQQIPFAEIGKGLGLS